MQINRNLRLQDKVELEDTIYKQFFKANKLFQIIDSVTMIFCFGYSRAKQVDEPAEAELVHVVDGGQVVAGEVQLHRELGQILKFK